VVAGRGGVVGDVLIDPIHLRGAGDIRGVALVGGEMVIDHVGVADGRRDPGVRERLGGKPTGRGRVDEVPVGGRPAGGNGRIDVVVPVADHGDVFRVAGELRLEGTEVGAVHDLLECPDVHVGARDDVARVGELQGVVRGTVGGVAEPFEGPGSEVQGRAGPFRGNGRERPPAGPDRYRRDEGLTGSERDQGKNAEHREHTAARRRHESSPEQAVRAQESMPYRAGKATVDSVFVR
jgi:hypothetical protein